MRVRMAISWTSGTICCCMNRKEGVTTYPLAVFDARHMVVLKHQITNGERFTEACEPPGDSIFDADVTQAYLIKASRLLSLKK